QAHPEPRLPHRAARRCAQHRVRPRASGCRRAAAFTRQHPNTYVHDVLARTWWWSVAVESITPSVSRRPPPTTARPCGVPELGADPLLEFAAQTTKPATGVQGNVGAYDPARFILRLRNRAAEQCSTRPTPTHSRREREREMARR